MVEGKGYPNTKLFELTSPYERIIEYFVVLSDSTNDCRPA